MLPDEHGRRRHKRAPRKSRSVAARYGAAARRDLPDAAQLVAEMQAAGAIFFIHANAERTDFRYACRYREGANVRRCRELFAQAKADPELLALVRVAIFVIIMRDAWDLPAGRR